MQKDNMVSITYKLIFASFIHNMNFEMNDQLSCESLGPVWLLQIRITSTKVKLKKKEDI